MSLEVQGRLQKNFHLDPLVNPNNDENMYEYYREQDAKEFKISYYCPEQHQYMNMMNKGLGVTGINEILENLKTDTHLLHVNFARNIHVDEASLPRKMQALHASLRATLKQNKTLTCLDLSYNHLFDFTKHPTNEHVHNYLIELTDSLVKSKVVRLNISGNFLCGKGGREYTGILYLVRKYCARGGLRSLIVRDNRLHSQGCAAVSESLGVFSKLEELDLRDNFLGLDPTGRLNSEGMRTIAKQLSQSPHLHTVRLARNCLRDEDITYLGDAICYMPRLEILDLNGNLFTGIGMIALKNAIISHSALTGANEGLKKLDLSFNKIAEVEGMVQLCEALKCTMTLYSLGLRGCSIGPMDMKHLQETLADNGTILELDINENRIPPVLLGLTNAEVEGLNVVYSLKKDHMALDTAKLTGAVYKTTARKLRYLPSEVLQKCYENPSIMKEGSEMRVYLELYEPPSRKVLIKGILDKDEKLKHSRLGHSNEHDDKLKQMHRIFHAVMRWWNVKRKEKSLKARLQQQKEAAAKASQKNEESAF
jgi:Leucine-rich repeat (LRR) protein